MSNTTYKSIHISKLWVGAVFALAVNKSDGSPVVWYHVDCIYKNGALDVTAMHTGKDYHYYNDRNVRIRQFN